MLRPKEFYLVRLNRVTGQGDRLPESPSTRGGSSLCRCCAHAIIPARLPARPATRRGGTRGSGGRGVQARRGGRL